MLARLDEIMSPGRKYRPGARLLALADAIQEYERVHFPEFNR
jgi:hypothetical protein